MIGQQKGHACKITHPDSVLVGSRVIFSNANILIALCLLQKSSVVVNDATYQRVTPESNHDQSAH